MELCPETPSMIVLSLPYDEVFVHRKRIPVARDRSGSSCGLSYALPGSWQFCPGASQRPCACRERGVKGTHLLSAGPWFLRASRHPRSGQFISHLDSALALSLALLYVLQDLSYSQN